ncbi:MAG: nucleotide exchange factor GrpE [Lachnospiraceae bacterium]|nr:nucleotide exchange factor GrpE [Lachnospiraceae bacterium]
MGLFNSGNSDDQEEMDNFENYDEADEDVTRQEILEILLNTREQYQFIENLVKNQIEVKDQQIDKLHSELEYYKKDSAERFSDQLMKAVIKVRKDMLKLINKDNFEDMSGDEIRREYVYISEDLTDLLEQQNVDPYRTEPGENFDPALHQPKLEITDDVTLDKTIKESLSEGYKKKDKVLIPERVIVYQYKQP